MKDLLSVLNHFKIEVSTLDEHILKDLHTKISQTFSYATCEYTSATAGQGKTRERQLSYKQCITGMITTDQFISAVEPQQQSLEESPEFMIPVEQPDLNGCIIFLFLHHTVR